MSFSQGETLCLTPLMDFWVLHPTRHTNSLTLHTSYSSFSVPVYEVSVTGCVSTSSPTDLPFPVRE